MDAEINDRLMASFMATVMLSLMLITPLGAALAWANGVRGGWDLAQAATCALLVYALGAGVVLILYRIEAAGWLSFAGGVVALGVVVAFIAAVCGYAWGLSGLRLAMTIGGAEALGLAGGVWMAAWLHYAERVR